MLLLKFSVASTALNCVFPVAAKASLINGPLANNFPIDRAAENFPVMKPWSWFIACGVIAMLALGLYFLNLPQEWRPAHPDAGHEIVVRLIQARRVSLPRRIRINGELRPQRVFDVVTRLAGKVKEVRYKVGDYVKPGSVIATVQADGLELRIHEQESRVRRSGEELQAREAEAAAAERRVTEHRELARRELISRRESEQAENLAETSRAQLQLSRASLAQQEAMLDQLMSLRALTRLVAPASGQVSRIFVKGGSLVGEQGAIMRLVDSEHLKLIEEVTGSEAGTLASGNQVEISTPDRPGVIGRGKVVRLEPVLDRTTRGYMIEIALADTRRIFYPGMNVDAWIDLDASDELLLIPRAAIVWENKQPLVFKVETGQALRQKVRLGHDVDDRVEVTEGLTDQDWVIVDHPKNLHSGDRVRAGNS